MKSEDGNYCAEYMKIHTYDLSYHCECGASVLRPEANPAGWGRTAAGDPICKSCRDEVEYLEGVRLENIEREWK